MYGAFRMGITKFSWQKAFSVPGRACLLTIFLCSTFPLRAEPAVDLLLKAVLYIQDGDTAEKKADNALAVKKYSQALEILELIKNTDAWDHSMLDPRIVYCNDHIRQNRSSPGKTDGPLVLVRADDGEPYAEAVDVSVPAVPAKTNVQLTEGQQLRKELSQAQSRIIQLQKENWDLAQFPKQIEARLHKLEEVAPSDVASADRSVETLRNENRALKKILDDARMQASRVASSVPEPVRSTVSGGSDEVRALRAEVGVMNSQIQRLQSENRQLREQPRGLQERIESLEWSLKLARSSSQEKFEALLVENRGLKRVLDDLEKPGESARVVQLQDELERAEALYEASMAKEKKTTAGIRAELEARLKSAEEQLLVAQTPSDFKKAEELEITKRSLARTREELDQVSFQFAAVKLEKLRAEEREEILQKELERTRVKLAHFTPQEDQRKSRGTEVATAPSAPIAEPVLPKVVEEHAPGQGLALASSSFQGSVLLKNSAEKNVIVTFDDGAVPPLRSEMGVYRQNVFVGSVRITGPVRPPLAAADVLTGSIQKGDVVR